MKLSAISLVVFFQQSLFIASSAGLSRIGGHDLRRSATADQDERPAISLHHPRGVGPSQGRGPEERNIWLVVDVLSKSNDDGLHPEAVKMDLNRTPNERIFPTRAQLCIGGTENDVPMSVQIDWGEDPESPFNLWARYGADVNANRTYPFVAEGRDDFRWVRHVPESPQATTRLTNDEILDPATGMGVATTVLGYRPDRLIVIGTSGRDYQRTPLRFVEDLLQSPALTSGTASLDFPTEQRLIDGKLYWSKRGWIGAKGVEKIYTMEAARRLIREFLNPGPGPPHLQQTYEIDQERSLLAGPLERPPAGPSDEEDEEGWDEDAPQEAAAEEGAPLRKVWVTFDIRSGDDAGIPIPESFFHEVAYPSRAQVCIGGTERDPPMNVQIDLEESNGFVFRAEYGDQVNANQFEPFATPRRRLDGIWTRKTFLLSREIRLTNDEIADPSTVDGVALMALLRRPGIIWFADGKLGNSYETQYLSPLHFIQSLLRQPSFIGSEWRSLAPDLDRELWKGIYHWQRSRSGADGMIILYYTVTPRLVNTFQQIHRMTRLSRIRSEARNGGAPVNGSLPPA